MTKRKGVRRNPMLRMAHTCNISAMAVLLASDKAPIPADMQRRDREHMLQSIDAIASSPAPSIVHWMHVADAINIMETLVLLNSADDSDGLIESAQRAINDAIERKGRTGAEVPRLDGPGLVAVRAAVESWVAMLQQLTHRAYLHALRQTELRLPSLSSGRILMSP